MPKKSAIGELASAKTKVVFADKLSSHTKLTADEIKTLFPTKSDRDELMELIKIVHSDADDKAKQAQLAENIGKVGGAIIKIAKTVIV
jgi:Trp operon repressor